MPLIVHAPKPFRLVMALLLLASAAWAGTGGSRSFNVPAGPASSTLKQFSEQAERELMFPAESVSAVRTKAVRGNMPPREALDRMLATTGLTVIQDPTTKALMIKQTSASATRSTTRQPTNPESSTNAMNSPSYRKTIRKWLRALVALNAALSVSAQTTTPASSTREEVIELSPFIVNAEEDTGYQAAKTLAGSRLNTDLKDTAASLSIMTAEFLRDIGATDIDDAVAFGNNVELDYTNANNDNGTNEFFKTYRIRGQAAIIARNYFRWKLPGDLFNVERVEEARGPNAILFGIASAGGLISTQTKQASTARSFRRAQLVYGSYDMRRASVDINQASDNGRFGVRFNAVINNTQGYQHYVFNQDTRGHLAVKYNLAPNTVVRAEYEKGKTFRNTPMSQMVGDSVMAWINAGRPLVNTPVANSANGIGIGTNNGDFSVVYIENDGVFQDKRGLAISRSAGSLITDPAVVDTDRFTINVAGPGQTQATTFDTYSAFIQQKLGKRTFLELAFSHQEYDFEAWQAFRPSGLQGDPNRFLKDGVTPNPHAGELFFETEWEQRLRNEDFDNLRLTASTEADFGKWGYYRVAGLAEREESFSEKRNYTDIWSGANGVGGAFGAATGSNNTVKHRHYVTEGDYSTYFGSFTNPGLRGYFSGVTNPINGATIAARGAQQGTGDFSDPSEQDSYLASGQAFYFKRKLVLSGGYRQDTIYLHEGQRGLKDPVTGDNYVNNVDFPRSFRAVHGKTKTYGAVYHMLPWLSLRYNKSDSLELPNGGIRIMPLPDANGHYIGSRVGDNPQGDGEDYGIDLDLFDGKVYARATYFTTNRIGAQQFRYGGNADNPTVLSNRIMNQLFNLNLVTQAERDQHQIDSGGSTFDTTSSGYEYSLTTNVTKNWRLQANYSITDSVNTNTASEIQAWAAVEIPYFQTFDQSIPIPPGNNVGATTIGADIIRWQLANDANRSADGLAAIGNRAKKVSVVTRYSFANGMLKGLSVGATARHQSKNVIGVSSAGQILYGNSFTRADAFAEYRFGRTSHLSFLKNLSLRLNVFNVLDQHDGLLLNVANVNAANLSYNRVRPQDPRSWRLTADFAF